MRRSWMQVPGSFFLAALIFSPAWGAVPPQPGTVNYIEGQVSMGSQTLSETSVSSVTLAAGQSLSTQNGRAEILLTPGIFFRIGERSSVHMISPGLADTRLMLQKGRAIVEVADIRKENDLRISQNGASTRLEKAGLYEFDADRGQIRVFDGEAEIQAGGRTIKVKSGHELVLSTGGKLQAQKFDKKASVDEFYRWASLRSSYLADANVDMTRTYVMGGGSPPGNWYGNGWYWDPWFDAFTFIPGDGIFFGPFGGGFYSPLFAMYAPFYGYGFGGIQHRFGPGYHPLNPAGGRASGFVGHAQGFHGGGIGGFSRGGGFRGGGGGFHGGGGGFHGGGFHGGGGGGGHRR